MPREFRHFLYDIRQAIAIIDKAAAGKSFSDYQSDEFFRLGLERAIEIISEASRHIPEDLKASRPEIAWASVKGIGNVLRHEYHGLSDKIIWGVISDEIPRLKIAIQAMLDALEQQR